MISSKEIIEIFSYSRDEQETFDYLHRYMNRISERLPEIETDNEKLKRFALAGLFLTYRAFNHQGSTMTTEVGDLSSESIHYKRLGIFREYFGTEIKDTSHYLSLINFSILHFILMILRISNISRKLYYFVIR
jgi:hypothetical protein